jgi:hypothetical protein
MDAFDRFWQWAEKPLDRQPTIPPDLHQAAMGVGSGGPKRSQKGQRSRGEDPATSANGPCGLVV